MTDHTVLTVTKRSAARAEIEGAIRLLAHFSNFVGAELLASAAIDVIRGVANKSQAETLSRQLDDRIRPERLNEFRAIIRQPYNFMKHSDRDAGHAIDEYRSDAAIWRVFIALADYQAVWKTRSLPMIVFLAWFVSRYPSVLKEEHSQIVDKISVKFGSVAQMSETRALANLRKVLEEMDDLLPEVRRMWEKGGTYQIEW